jgi:hypothetical protein
MTDFSDIIDDVLAIAEQVAPLIHPAAPAAIAAGKSVIGLIEKIKTTAGETDAVKLNAALSDLEARVFAHADQTAANLRK